MRKFKRKFIIAFALTLAINNLFSQIIKFDKKNIFGKKYLTISYFNNDSVSHCITNPRLIQFKNKLDYNDTIIPFFIDDFPQFLSVLPKQEIILKIIVKKRLIDTIYFNIFDINKEYKKSKLLVFNTSLNYFEKKIYWSNEYMIFPSLLFRKNVYMRKL